MCEASDHVEFVGLEIKKNILTIKEGRIWKLRRAIRHVLARGRISGSVLEVLIGHATWAMLLRRESLSILDDCYDHIRNHYRSIMPLSRACRRELAQVAGILPLLSADPRVEWSPTILVSDASPFGIGV